MDTESRVQKSQTETLSAEQDAAGLTPEEKEALEKEWNQLLNQREEMRGKLMLELQTALGDEDVDYGMEQTFKKFPDLLEKLKEDLTHEQRSDLLLAATAMPWNRFGRVGEVRKLVDSEASKQIAELDTRIDALYARLHPEYQAQAQ
ncbi:MAG: hypothetical protein ABIG66_03390 [Candidatus Kerfeldbacteria bacterium]